MDRLLIYIFQTKEKKTIWSDLDLKKEDYISFSDVEDEYVAVVLKSYKDIINKNLNINSKFNPNLKEFSQENFESSFKLRKEDKNKDKEKLEKNETENNLNKNGKITNIKKLSSEEVKEYLNRKIETKKLYKEIEKDIENEKLDMILKDVETNYLNTKIIISYISENRVDFREFVKKVAKKYKKRIDMVQLSPVDEIKIIGGLGKCGRKLCCISFLARPINSSIKIAKDQGISLNSDNISGECGKLMCCLNYEKDAYDDVKSKLPKIGEKVLVEDGEGEVVSLEILKEIIKIKLFDENSGDYYFKNIKYNEIIKNNE